MALENDPSARMQVRPMGQLMHPAACMVCGNGTCEQGYLDLGVFYDYEGHMYLCLTCAYQAGETVGLYTPDQMRIAEGIASTALGEAEGLRAQVVELSEYSDSLHSVLRADLYIGNSSNSNVSVEPLPDDSDPSRTSEGSASGEPESEESAKIDERPNPRRSELRDITFG